MEKEIPPHASQPVRFWAKEDRPREKMVNKGKTSLTDAELLAILMNTGTKDESVINLSQRVLSAVQNDLLRLSRLSIQELMRFKGIGEAKAITIAAALELGRRRRDKEAYSKPFIKSSKQAFEILATSLSDIPHEEFWILVLNRANKVTGKYKVSSGGLTGTVADQRIIFKKALDDAACCLILAHNHPSGNLKPSQADIQLTKKMVEAGKILDIDVMDHLIISETDYYSFADNGLL